MKKGIVDDIADFLEYLAEIDDSSQKRLESDLSKKFGNEKFDRLVSICLFGESRYVAREVLGDKVKKFRLRITPKGLMFLSRYHSEKTIETNNKLTIFLTTTLAITAIATFFNELRLIPPIILMLIYGVAMLIFYRYFTKSNNVQF